MEKIATSFCSFEVLRKHYTYDDKTDVQWRHIVGVKMNNAKTKIAGNHEFAFYSPKSPCGFGI